ncbi:YuzL family protein [Pseudalkalibacillus caeni]|uniref:YuzL family protein n=1 Tax=Exobacillus caeni TaxID=2574798 RepID=A0A5R9F5E1_9BACL|nr:YuzL family protein [Pseudalkalibacillus caeni]TLS38251.1 YuzL family protein [Pseudalkalibacillus caeni]
MSKRKKDPSTIGLPSSQPEGQGTGVELGRPKDSARKKKKSL